MHRGLCCLPSLQLTLPEGTLPRWGHTVTSYQVDQRRIHATTFGGCPDFDLNRSYDDDPKLADTTVMEFGESNRGERRGRTTSMPHTAFIAGALKCTHLYCCLKPGNIAMVTSMFKFVS